MCQLELSVGIERTDIRFMEFFVLYLVLNSLYSSYWKIDISKISISFRIPGKSRSGNLSEMIGLVILLIVSSVGFLNGQLSCKYEHEYFGHRAHR